MARGIVVETDDFDRLRAKLYTLREENMEEFGNLSLVRSPLNGKDLWIICQPKEPRNGEDE